MSVSLFISSSKEAMTQIGEHRFDLSMTIGRLKERLELVVGSKPSDMALYLVPERKPGQAADSKTTDSVLLGDDTRPLGYYSPADWMILHVVDTNPDSLYGEFTIPSLHRNYEYVTLSEEEYDRLTGSVRAYMKRMKLGKYSDEARQQQEAQQVLEGQRTELARGITVGARCEVTTQESAKQRGEVAFVGEVAFAPGTWVGVKLDLPFGKNDGSVDGQRYFTCLPKYGMFVRPDRLEVGDFEPAFDLDAALEGLTSDSEDSGIEEL
ncbi:hypothetical protein H696_05607 [Fonticula alba]|uniref:CAP-Gly domain-containing protein n=1 Tax=Fonticula alba TaxID=691883 RepID=A0A058Z1S1_FONAL|nr:hypothetical protein H696_05607 [Fonticula alba]KCV67878.1 hypothetical protein H696_05607 [Fonticula alba]|eukprot:XP_009497698.1 hypothetical protein H696_05607 [Fonticula alba]